MLQLPSGFQDTISNFSIAFRKDVWGKAQILLLGSIICPGSRTVCNVLRSVGLRWEKNFPKYHRFLSQDKWSGKKLSEVLLNLLVSAFIKEGEALVFGIDDTIERRWGGKIKKRAIYRDPVRSSKSHFVKCSGLRWLSIMLLSPLPWLEKGIYWALPVLTVLCPSKRYYSKEGKSVKKLTTWAVQIISWLSRRCSAMNRPVFLTGDGSFATLELFIHAQIHKIGMIARMKMNARLYHLPPENYPKNKRGPRPPVGERIQSMSERLIDKNTEWQSVTFSEWYGNRDKDIVRFFVRRWRVEVTFAEVRRHLGVETQRQWSDLAIDRTTPCLMALFSVVCLFGKNLNDFQKIMPNRAAWYKKKGVTFSDVLAAVRLEIFQTQKLLTSSKKDLIHSYSENIKPLWELLTQAVA